MRAPSEETLDAAWASAGALLPDERVPHPLWSFPRLRCSPPKVSEMLCLAVAAPLGPIRCSRCVSASKCLGPAGRRLVLQAARGEHGAVQRRHRQNRDPGASPSRYVPRMFGVLWRLGLVPLT